ncbi:hypothetical protein PAAG_12503 [Paracoccidioides lutzii Pb01]|uniref:Uncharacterized protein n=1 Tax=Paracoccidioides lutzii (strain ATCC MYA-826 / Pb01) TaxID=502779 RepID=A0A0A2V008_PARBA|nr:hypothetical protein PAAG_12503 [Paracoccidioides lutzii Pb01]KGQ00838.1 hypothetical protein PAAG_12503 [Paracoccidioides lutzii Pb01]
MATALLASSVAVWGASSVVAEVNSMVKKGKRRFAVGLAWFLAGLGPESRQGSLSDADVDVVAGAYADVGRGADLVVSVGIAACWACENASCEKPWGFIRGWIREEGNLEEETQAQTGPTAV